MDRILCSGTSKIYYKIIQTDPNKSPMIEDGYCSIYIVLLIYKKKNPGDQNNNYAIMVPKRQNLCNHNHLVRQPSLPKRDLRKGVEFGLRMHLG